LSQNAEAEKQMSRQNIKKKNMKKFLYLSMVVITMLFVSCTEDFTDPKALSGTTWRCSDFSSISDYSTTSEYIEFRFTSTTAVEGWSKEKNATVQQGWTGSYSVKGNVLTITSEGDTQSLTIDKKTMTMSLGGISLVFNKQ
jgi:hypothetical protein